MKTEEIKASIVFISPAGSTRKIALHIQDRLQCCGLKTTCIDLSADYDMKQLADTDLLLICSPVYAYHPVPPVISFISELNNKSFYAVLFVSWGGVTSGTALFDMAKGIEEKGGTVIGAAKILSPHSLMLQSAKPLGAGHPCPSDMELIDKLLEQTVDAVKSGIEKPMDIERLVYQPENRLDEMRKTTLEKAKALLPPINEVISRCNKCGICLEQCPVNAITLTPSLTISNNCINCYNCTYACPEKAITADLSNLDEWLKHKAVECAEQEKSQIFY